jgi:hypothetical protein
MEIMYVPAGATGRFQVNDTHMHKYVGSHARTHTRSNRHIYTRIHNNNNNKFYT